MQQAITNQRWIAHDQCLFLGGLGGLGEEGRRDGQEEGRKGKERGDRSKGEGRE